MIYNIFGSADSKDCDIMVFVNAIGSVAENKLIVARHTEVLQSLYDKQVNVNLAVVNNEIISEVFKGTPDEVNNSLIETYSLHQQKFPPQVTRRVERHAGIKALRSMRAILSFISRTEHRELVKQALSGTATDKHKALSAIQLGAIKELGNKNTDLIDFHKTVAFQVGQSYLLNIGIEVYTKSDIAFQFPELLPFLKRTGDGDPLILDRTKDLWLNSFAPENIPVYEELRK